MPLKRYKLRNLEINRVDLVEQAANPHAHVLFYKRAPAADVSVLKRAAAVLQSLLPAAVQKADSAEAEIFKRADQLVADDKAKSRAVAVDDVLQADGALAKRYADESGARVRDGGRRTSTIATDAELIVEAIAKAAAATPRGSLYAEADTWVADGRAATREQAIATMSMSSDPAVQALVEQARAADAEVDSVLLRIAQRLQGLERNDRVEHLRQVFDDSPGFISELLRGLEHRIGADLA